MATDLNAAFAELIAEHDITSISVGCGTGYAEGMAWTCYVHWDGYSNTGHACTSEHGATAEAAITATINRMKGERQASVGCPDLTIAA